MGDGRPGRRAARLAARRPRRLLVAVAAAAALLAAGAPAPTAAAPADGGPYRVQLVYRVGRSLAPVTVRVTARSTNGKAVWMATEVHRHGPGWRVDTAGPLVGARGFLLPSVYGAPGASEAPRCPELPREACDMPVPADASMGWEVRPQATSRIYVVSAGMEGMKVEVDSKDWRVRDVTGLRVRRVFGEDSAATGANVWGETVESFQSAVAPGGRYGSVVYASLPCGETGRGEARLEAHGARDIGGGMAPRPLRCGLRETGASWAFAYTPAQAQWRLSGDVTGVGFDPTRLLVLDLPKP